jgi:hypothetical protein
LIASKNSKNWLREHTKGERERGTRKKGELRRGEEAEGGGGPPPMENPDLEVLGPARERGSQK